MDFKLRCDVHLLMPLKWMPRQDLSSNLLGECFAKLKSDAADSEVYQGMHAQDIFMITVCRRSMPWTMTGACKPTAACVPRPGAAWGLFRRCPCSTTAWQTCGAPMTWQSDQPLPRRLAGSSLQAAPEAPTHQVRLTAGCRGHCGQVDCVPHVMLGASLALCISWWVASPCLVQKRRAGDGCHPRRAHMMCMAADAAREDRATKLVHTVLFRQLRRTLPAGNLAVRQVDAFSPAVAACMPAVILNTHSFGG